MYNSVVGFSRKRETTIPRMVTPKVLLKYTCYLFSAERSRAKPRCSYGAPLPGTLTLTIENNLTSSVDVNSAR